eukprot:UN22260
MIIKPIEKCLERVEKKFRLKMRVSPEYSILIFASFFKISVYFLFLPYKFNLIIVPYGHDFFTGVMN